MRTLLLALHLTCTLLAVGWPVTYHVVTGGDWRHRPMGRHLMAFAIVLAAMLALTAAARYLPPAVTMWAALAAYVAFVIVLFGRYRALYRAQRDATKEA